MNVKLLVDAIVRQTTVLIAELCTAAGVRAPMAHIADEVFLGLVRQLEEQGVSRKVAADMFGYALRGYQNKVRRLTESETQGGKTLWQAIVEFLAEEQSVPRARVLERFRGDDHDDVKAILNDLVASKLAFTTGRGAGVVYALTPEEDRVRWIAEEDGDSLCEMVALLVSRQGPMSAQEVAERLRSDEVETAIARLLREGRISRDGCTGKLSGASLRIDVGASAGWEAAVFDHFQSLVKAVASKLRQGPVSNASDTVGGATLSFDVRAGHPLEHQVTSLLQDVRAKASDLWTRVERLNEANPIAEDQRTVVTFYFGQNVERPGAGELRPEAKGNEPG